MSHFSVSFAILVPLNEFGVKVFNFSSHDLIVESGTIFILSFLEKVFSVIKIDFTFIKKFP